MALKQGNSWNDAVKSGKDLCLVLFLSAVLCAGRKVLPLHICGRSDTGRPLQKCQALNLSTVLALCKQLGAVAAVGSIWSCRLSNCIHLLYNSSYIAAQCELETLDVDKP